MTDPTQEAKFEYFKRTCELLQAYPDELRAFESLWKAGQLRHAYVSAMEAARNLGLTRTAAADKADEDFFWLWMH